MKQHLRQSHAFLIFLTMFCLSLIRCGEDNQTFVVDEDKQIIAIVEFNFIPTAITASPGETIFFYNDNDVPHQILSQSAPDQFDNTGEFDSLIINPGQTRFIIIPEDTPSGTTLYFYDGSLQGGMITPNGEIIVD